MRLLSGLLRRFVQKGQLVVTDHDGSRHSFGSGQDGPTVHIRFTDAKVANEIFFNPELKAAEAYMDGRLVFAEGQGAYDLLYLFSVNRRGLAAHPWQRVLNRFFRAIRRWHQHNAAARAIANARSHYDHPAAFYALWLDPSMAYSCAYFQHPHLSLAAAQEAKYRHIAAKLALEPGMRVAEIGSGWGGLSIYMARHCGVEVTAINPATEQLAASRVKAAEAGAAARITFLEQDYRTVTGTFDRVVSVGMMEHVGVSYFETYFSQVKAMLAPGGFALIHAIGSMSPPSATSPFIRKHIFPGGYSPALSEVFAATEKAGLWVCDCEVLRLHYYWTIRHWRETFMARRTEVIAMMGDRFARMWEFYLAAVELGFLHGSNMVFQLLVSSTRDAVPVTRDYMHEREQALATRAQDAANLA
jgi:cyclopropane-fatty-acyl-phospholipid synthase